MSYISMSYRQYVDINPIGSECVDYIREILKKDNIYIKTTDQYVRGEKVLNNSNILPGTVIATFNEQGKYWSHVAFYDSQNTNEGIKIIYVVDQIKINGIIQKPNTRPISDRSGNGYPSNDASRYYVVE